MKTQTIAAATVYFTYLNKGDNRLGEWRTRFFSDETAESAARAWVEIQGRNFGQNLEFKKIDFIGSY